MTPANPLASIVLTRGNLASTGRFLLHMLGGMAGAVSGGSMMSSAVAALGRDASISLNLGLINRKPR